MQIKDEDRVKASAYSGLALIAYIENELEDALLNLHEWQKYEPENEVCESFMETILLDLAKISSINPLPIIDESWLDDDLLQIELEQKVSDLKQIVNYKPQSDHHQVPKSSISIKSSETKIFGQFKGRSSAANELSPNIFGPSSSAKPILNFGSSSPFGLQHSPPRTNNRRRLFDKESEQDLDEKSSTGIQFSLNADHSFEDDIFDDPNSNSMEIDVESE